MFPSEEPSPFSLVVGQVGGPGLSRHFQLRPQSLLGPCCGLNCALSPLPSLPMLKSQFPVPVNVTSFRCRILEGRWCEGRMPREAEGLAFTNQGTPKIVSR